MLEQKTWRFLCMCYVQKKKHIQFTSKKVKMQASKLPGYVAKLGILKKNSSERRSLRYNIWPPHRKIKT